MATHFSTIGLSIQTDAELVECIERILPTAEKFPTPSGTYHRWRDPSGAELWIQFNAENELVGVNPHFGGRSRVRALLTHSIASGSPGTLDGRFSGWADPAKATPESSGAYPFLFDAPDAACHHALEMPSEVDIQVAAFVHDIQVYANSRAYDATQTSDQWHTSDTFIPSGLMGGSELKAEAAFNGHVIAVERQNQSAHRGGVRLVSRAEYRRDLRRRRRPRSPSGATPGGRCDQRIVLALRPDRRMRGSLHQYSGYRHVETTPHARTQVTSELLRSTALAHPAIEVRDLREGDAIGCGVLEPVHRAEMDHAGAELPVHLIHRVG